MDRAAEFATPFAEPIVVGFMEWTDPIFIGGHWVPQLIERAGGAHPLNPCVAKPGSGAAIGPQQAEKVAGKSIAVTPEVFAAAKPEALVICPCGVALDGVRAHAEALARQPWFAELPAVRTGKVALVDGNQMFSRPGPRLAEAFAFLCGFLNDRPELIPDDFPWQPMR
jgi:ABC-type Fe3+-hydroxamate transport system substrate-binding protein